jgi:hypothetical protein
MDPFGYILSSLPVPERQKDGIVDAHHLVVWMS